MSKPADDRLADLLPHAPFVRGLARALLGGDSQVDDVVQETWMAALAGGPGAAGEERAWLGRVVRNRVYLHWRRQGRLRAREQRAARQEALPSTGEIATREETRRELIRQLLALREPYRSALILRYYEELPPRDVALRLGVPVETARTRIKRGLALLRDALDRAPGGGREAWLGALLPLARMPATGGGAVITGAGAKLAVVCTLLGLLGLGTFLWLGNRAMAPGAGQAGKPGRPALAKPVLVGRAPAASTLEPRDEAGRCRLTGTVTRLGKPLEATVTLGGVGTARHVKSTKEGHFAFENESHGTRTVTVRAADGVAVQTAAWFRANGQYLTADLDVPPAGPGVSGAVQWADGRPFRGTVTLSLDRQRRGPVLTASTDALGRFELPYAPPGSQSLRLLIPGQFSSGHPVTVDSQTTTEVQIVLDERLAPWRGRVVSQDGEPVPGVRLQASGIHEGARRLSLLAWATTDETGAVHITAAPGGSMHMVASPHRPLAPWRFEDKELRVTRGATLRGSVRNKEGISVGAGLRVVVVSEQVVKVGDHAVSVETETDAEGLYAATVSPGQVFAYAAGLGLISPETADLRRGAIVPQAQPLLEGEGGVQYLEVVPMGTLSGHVRDEEDRPIRGALVCLNIQSSASIHRGLSRGGACVATDANGHFRVAGVLPGYEMVARVTHPDFVRTESAPFALDSGTAAEVELVLPRPRYVDVLVLDAESGEPVSDAKVEIARARKWPWSFEFGGHVGHSNEEGRVRLHGLAPGGLGIHANAPGYAREHDYVAIQGSRAPGPLETVVRLRPGLEFSGRVEVPDGVPLDQVRTTLQPIEGTGGGWSPSGGAVQTDGRFAYTGMPPGAYRLRAFAHHEGERYAGSLVLRASEQAVILRLSADHPPGSWRIRVRSPAGAWAWTSVRLYGKRESGAWVQHRDLHGPRDSKGGVAALGPTPWFKQVYVWIRGRGERDTPSTGSVLLGPLPATGGTFDVTLPEERRVRGKVQWADGQPAAGITLRCEPEISPGFRPQVSKGDRALTDARGSFEFRALGRLPYRIEFQKDADGWKPPAFSLRAEDDEPSITLPSPPGTITLTVRNNHGRPAAQAYAVVYAGDGPVDPFKALLRTNAGGDGIVRLRGLDAARRYRVLVGGGKYGRELATTAITGWVPEDQTIQLDRSLPIEGEIRMPDGRLARRAWLYRRGPFGAWRLVQEHPTIPFRTWVPAGRHEFIAWSQGRGRPDANDRGTWLEAGDKHARVPFNPGPALWCEIENWTEGTQIHGEVRREAPDGGEQPNLHGRFDPAGRLELYHLDPDATYSLFFRVGNDYERPHSFVRASGLVPGAQTVQLRIEPGHTLSGRMLLPKNIDTASVRLYARVKAHRLWVRLREGGTFELSGLPAGEWPLEVQRVSDDKVLRRILLPTGQSTEVSLR